MILSFWLFSHDLLSSLQVKFGKKAKKAATVDETRFFLLNLGLLREYLLLEFSPIRDKITFGFEIERLIDDWILMCFMVGNDFIPNLPNLHINSNALPTLYKAYMEVLPTLGGYMNESGKINLPRLEAFMAKLADVDRDLFRDHYADIKEFEVDHVRGIRWKLLKRSLRPFFLQKNEETFGADLNSDTKNDLNAMIKATVRISSPIVPVAMY